jgi:hypothetical protein
MNAYAGKLFRIAALFNFIVGGSLIFLRPRLGPLLHLDPVTGTNIAIFNLAGALIATFGYAYWRAGQDPKTYRAYIELGVFGKLLAVAVVTATWMAGLTDARIPGLVAGDLVFAGLFVDYLRRTRATR